MRGIALFLLLIAATPALAEPCATRAFEGSRFTVCTYDARHDEVRLALTDRHGTALRGFARLGDTLGPTRRRVLFAMNAGMFGDDGRPVGLYVEKSVQRHRLNLEDGFGNFYMKPNGVFWIARDGSAHIETANTFSAKPLFATQSGPMLVIGGKLHPSISQDGMSAKVRNGVGVHDGRTAFFVASDEAVSFGRLARFFRDELHCPDALYFDGTISSSWIPSRHRLDHANPLGPMVLVLKK